MVRFTVPCLLAALSSVALADADVDYSQYLNPFMGADGYYGGQAFAGGDIFVGGAVPFGVAKVGIDTYELNVSFATLNGGYTPDGVVTAISMMHESGTGGSPKYGIVAQMPLTQVDGPVNILDNTTYWQNRTGNEKAGVGYYSTGLKNGVQLDLAGARHSGIMQYSYPEGGKHVVVDASHYLPNPSGSSDNQYYAGGALELHNGGKTYTGYTAVGGGFSDAPPSTVYFCGEFDQTPSEAKTFSGISTQPIRQYFTKYGVPIPHPTFHGDKNITSGPRNDRVGALFSWPNKGAATVKSKVGISFISREKACMWKDKEIKSWNVNDTIQAAKDEWNKDVFSKVKVPLGPSQNLTNIRLMYSSLYFMHLMPSDRTGENPFWDSGDYWDDFFTFWDIFRCTVSLYHLIQPSYYASMLRGVLGIFEYEGWAPDSRSGNYNGIVQGGSNSDNVFADAYIKKLDGVNWTLAYESMKKNAEVIPYNTFSPVDLTNGIKEGRGALYDWIPLGYLSSDQSTRFVSRTIEYSLNDYSLSVVAATVAPDEVHKYLNRSANWQNIWAHNVTHAGFTGFPAPRLSTGEFNLTDYNPTLCGNCEWSAISYEAVPFEYQFTIPHDMVTLKKFMGGDADFERRLDYMFLPGKVEQNLGANGLGIDTIMNIGNEPDFATPYLYHYINKSWKSVNISRSLGHQYFHDAGYGVPGNSDAGALNSWLIWQMLGLYPIVTQDVYLLSSPWFKEVNMTVNGNKTLHIKANNLDEASGSYFVQSVKINGKPWHTNWFRHDDVMVNGGTIEFELGCNHTVWENGDEPPSPGHYEKPLVK